jgi:hypothetical protein
VISADITDIERRTAEVAARRELLMLEQAFAQDDRVGALHMGYFRFAHWLHRLAEVDLVDAYTYTLEREWQMRSGNYDEKHLADATAAILKLILKGRKA